MNCFTARIWRASRAPASTTPCSASTPRTGRPSRRPSSRCGAACSRSELCRAATRLAFGRGDDTVGNPHRAQICQFELFEFILLLKVDNQFSIEQFEPTLSQSTVPSPTLRHAPLRRHRDGCAGAAHGVQRGGHLANNTTWLTRVFFKRSG